MALHVVGDDCVARDDEVDAAEPDSEPERRPAGRKRRVRHVELERADAELVRLVQLGGRGDPVGPVADAVAEVPDRGDRDCRGRHCGDDQRREHAEEDAQGTASPAFGSPLTPEDDRADDCEHDPDAVSARPEVFVADQDQAGERQQPEADDGPRPLPTGPQHLRCDRLVLPLLGKDEPAGDVDEEPGAAEHGEDDEADPEDDRIEVEVLGQAARDAGDLAIGPAPLEAAGLRCTV